MFGIFFSAQHRLYDLLNKIQTLENFHLRYDSKQDVFKTLTSSLNKMQCLKQDLISH